MGDMGGSYSLQGAPQTSPGRWWGLPGSLPKTHVGGDVLAVVRCPRCFQEREEARRPVLAELVICGGCAIELGAAIGFLEFLGYRLQKALPLDADMARPEHEAPRTVDPEALDPVTDNEGNPLPPSETPSDPKVPGKGSKAA